MKPLEGILNDDPALAKQMRELTAVLDMRHTRPLVRGHEDLVYAIQPSEASPEDNGFRLQWQAADEVVAEDTPPAGIYGLGVTLDETGRAPTILVLPSLSDGSIMKPIPVWELPEARAVIKEYLELSGFKKEGPAYDLRAMGIPPPEEQAVAIGGPIKCGIADGRCGVEVKYQGERCVFTAGHVGWPVGAEVLADGDVFGEVIHADRLSNHQPGQVVADVSVIRLNSAVDVRRPASWPSHAPVTMVTGEDNAVVVAGDAEGEIHTLMQDFALRQGWGKWADVYFVTAGISGRGDSGSPVYMKSNPLATIGHVVGGTPGYFSLIQDMKFLLETTGAELP